MQIAETHTEIGLVQTFSEYDFDEWLELRHSDVTASKVGALFGVHDYSSPLQLYSEKIQLRPSKIEDNGVLRRGRWFEPVAIAIAREMRPKWEITEPGIYLRDAESRIGATPDAVFVDDNGELGVLQVKTVARQVFKEKWRQSDGEITVPFWIILQAYTEATLLNHSKAAVAALIVDEFDPQLHIIEFDCPPKTYGRIRREVDRFWYSVEKRTPPAADYTKDLRALTELYTGTGDIVDKSDDGKFLKLLEEREAIKERLKAAEADDKESKARVIAAMGNAEAALCGIRFVTFKEQTRQAHAVKESTFRVLRIGKRTDGKKAR
jgi:predicted phage-related endonuclease